MLSWIHLLNYIEYIVTWVWRVDYYRCLINILTFFLNPVTNSFSWNKGGIMVFSCCLKRTSMEQYGFQFLWTLGNLFLSRSCVSRHLSRIMHFRWFCRNFHCVKSVQIRNYFWSVFSRIRIEYGAILRKNRWGWKLLTIITKCSILVYLSVFCPNAGKYGPEITWYLDTIHEVVSQSDDCFQCFCGGLCILFFFRKLTILFILL